MADAVDFNSLLTREVGTSEAPKPVPAGSYIFSVTKREFDKTKPKDNKTPTPIVRFLVKPVQPLEDVSEDELTEFGGMEKLSEKELRHEFYVTADAIYRLEKFLAEDLALGTGMSNAEAIDSSPGAQFMGMIVHQPGKSEGQVYTNIGQTGPVPQ